MPESIHDRDLARADFRNVNLHAATFEDVNLSHASIAHANIEGLTVNGPVWLAGNNVGRVSAITFLAPDAEKAIRVELDLDSRIQHRIRLDSVAMIGALANAEDPGGTARDLLLQSGSRGEPRR